MQTRILNKYQFKIHYNLSFDNCVIKVQRTEFRDLKMFKIVWILLLVGSLYCQVIVFVEISEKEDIGLIISRLLRPRLPENEYNTRNKRETEDLKECALVDDQARECVPYHLCKRNSEKPVGFCPTDLDTCCLVSDKITN